MNLTFRRLAVAPLSLVVSAVLAASTLTVLVPTAAAAPARADGPAPIEDRTSAMVSTDPLPTAQINGVVYSQVVVGNTVFAAGSFSKARPAGAKAGQKEVSRKNFIGYSLSTGKMRSWAPTFDGTVRELALSPDQKTLYAVGDFTHVGSTVRSRFAAFDIAKRKLRSLDPVFNQKVTAVYALDKTVYVGGWFTTVDGNARGKLAALTTSGSLVKSWAPVANGTTEAIVATPDNKRIVVGGNFTTLNGVDANGMGSLDATTAANQPWKINEVIQNGGANAAVDSLRTDGKTIFGSAFAYRGGSGFEGAFAADPADGSVKWIQDCHGDTYDVAPVGDVLYSASHAHDCVNIGAFPDTRATSARYRSLAVSKEAKGTVVHTDQSESSFPDYQGQPAPALYNWFPNLTAGKYTGQNQAAWSLASTSKYLLLGGEFTAVNGTKQQGLVRLGVPGKVKAVESDQGPEPLATPTVRATTSTSATVSVKSTWDRDNLALGYELVLGKKVVATTSSSAPWWNRDVVELTATKLTPGRRYTFQVRARDKDGNTRSSVAVSTFTPSAYADQVAADGAVHQWRLDTSTPGTDPDRAGSLPLDLSDDVELGTKGALDDDEDTAATFAGADSTIARTLTDGTLGKDSSIELWFSTGAKSGGLARFHSDTPDSLYPQSVQLASGKVTFTASGADGSSTVVSSPGAGYANGKWHHLVATRAGDRTTLYLDGVAVGSADGAPSVDLSQRVGRWGFGSGFRGDLDELATYSTALSAAQVAKHHALGHG